MSARPRPGAPTGVCLPHRACGAADALRLALLAEDLGYDSVWVSELATYDAIALAAAVAVRTERIRVGTAIVPVSTRTPALHAMALSTLGHLAPGRSIVGFGISTEPIVAGWHGQDGVVSHALQQTRELFAILDQALAGERTAITGRCVRSTGFRLEAPAPDRPRRFVGALGPRMRQFTREHADGLLLNLAPRSALRDIAVREQGARSEVALPLRIAVGPEVADAERRFRRESASYLRVPAYARSVSDLGYADVVEQVAPLGDDLQAMADALPARFVDDLGVLAGAERAQGLLEQVRADGVTPLLVPIVRPGDIAGFEAVMRAVAPARTT